MNNHQDITRLIDRYMAGATTNDEEARLRAYFATAGDIPAEWAIYKALFGYVDGQRMETAHSLSTAPTAPRHTARRPAPMVRRLWIGAAAAAACSSNVPTEQTADFTNSTRTRSSLVSMTTVRSVMVTTRP